MNMLELLASILRSILFLFSALLNIGAALIPLAMLIVFMVYPTIFKDLYCEI